MLRLRHGKQNSGWWISADVADEGDEGLEYWTGGRMEWWDGKLETENLQLHASVRSFKINAF
jgi:hypothetical protein